MKIEFNAWFIALLCTITFFCIPLHGQEEELLASAEPDHFVILEPSYTTAKRNTLFEKKYHFLVAKSYFKLLAEAQKSERKLKMQLERYSFENEKSDRRGNKPYQRKLNVASKKYKAHSAMLFGLKSWNLFSDDRTGDMFYFMAENEDRIYQMYEKNFKEDKMINYLIYKLADLYHLEE